MLFYLKHVSTNKDILLIYIYDFGGVDVTTN